MKRAIVLAGGGAKGSYQMGVWKALKEKKIDYSIIVGNSIGSLNGALMVQNEYDLAMDMWNNIDTEGITSSNLHDTDDFELYDDSKEDLLSFLKKHIPNKTGDVSTFKKVIDTYVCEEKFFNSKTNYGLMTVHFPSMAPVEILKKNIKPSYLKKWVQASCSIFPALPMCKIDDDLYIDGLFYDNLPISTAFRLGADEVIAIALRPNISKKKFFNNPLVKFIEPNSSLGSTLSFAKEDIDKNINLGYVDTMKALGEVYGINFALKNIDKKIADIYGRRIIKLAMKDELLNELSSVNFISRHISPIPLTEKIFSINEVCCTSGFEIYLYCLESLLSINKFDPNKIYDVKKIMKNINELITEEVEHVVNTLYNNKFISEVMSKTSYETMAAALLIYSLRFQ